MYKKVKLFNKQNSSKSTSERKKIINLLFDVEKSSDFYFEFKKLSLIGILVSLATSK